MENDKEVIKLNAVIDMYEDKIKNFNAKITWLENMEEYCGKTMFKIKELVEQKIQIYGELFQANEKYKVNEKKEKELYDNNPLKREAINNIAQLNIQIKQIIKERAEVMDDFKLINSELEKEKKKLFSSSKRIDECYQQLDSYMADIKRYDQEGAILKNIMNQEKQKLANVAGAKDIIEQYFELQSKIEFWKQKYKEKEYQIDNAIKQVKSKLVKAIPKKMNYEFELDAKIVELMIEKINRYIKHIDTCTKKLASGTIKHNQEIQK